LRESTCGSMPGVLAFGSRVNRERKSLSSVLLPSSAPSFSKNSKTFWFYREKLQKPPPIKAISIGDRLLQHQPYRAGFEHQNTYYMLSPTAIGKENRPKKEICDRDVPLLSLAIASATGVRRTAMRIVAISHNIPELSAAELSKRNCTNQLVNNFCEDAICTIYCHPLFGVESRQL
jgi:hypothetical protein